MDANSAFGQARLSLSAKPKILVISLRRIGDLLLTTPLIHSLRGAYPDATIDVLVFTGTAGIVDGNPDIDQIIHMPTRPSMTETLAIVRRLFRRYELAISTQSGDRPTFFAALAGRTRVGLTDPQRARGGRNLKDRLLHRSTPVAANIHRVEQMLRLADLLGIPRLPELICPAAGSAEQIVAEANYAVIHAAPMFRYKQWTADGWRALAMGLKQRGLRVVAISGPGAAERAYLQEIWQGVATIYSTAWPATVALLQRARIYIGPDTSVTHLAAASGCLTVALFGPMDPRVWGPWPIGGLKTPWLASGTIQQRGNVWLVQHPLPCLPCTFEGCERHVESASVCMSELTVEQVLVAADQALTADHSEMLRTRAQSREDARSVRLQSR
jgi:heptosyltransferase-3